MAAHAPEQAVGAQAGATAYIARRIGPIARQQHAHVHLVRAGFQPLEIALDAVPVTLLPGALPIDDPLAFRLGQFAPGSIQADAAFLRMLFQILLAFLVRLGLPGAHGPLAQALVLVRDHQPIVDADAPTKAATGLAGADG